MLERIYLSKRNNRLIKGSSVRAIVHRLPFKTMPKLMLQGLVMDSAKKLNCFPPRGGTSDFYSPRMIMHKEVLDYEKHCVVPYGSYVQAHDENDPTHSLKPRAIDGIYLRFLSNLQGGHNIMNLMTGQVIKQRQVTMIPMTQHIIECVHKLAQREKMPEGMKVTSKTRVIF
jgi:hypothetical protein